jgi:hypothetical protein
VDRHLLKIPISAHFGVESPSLADFVVAPLLAVLTNGTVRSAPQKRRS